jgi:hypothetical protein
VIEETVPSGSLAVKVTVTVWPVLAGFGVNVLIVTVGGASKVTPAVPKLPACVESPLYVPVTVTDPAIVDVKVTEQLPLTNVHGLPAKIPFGAVKATVPVGVVAPAPFVSATTAVHVVIWLTATVLGKQDTVVEVVRRTPVTELVPELVA